MISFRKLWFYMRIEKRMRKSSLLQIMSSKTIAKLSKNETVNTDTINKICLFLECQPGDIMEVVFPDVYPDK